MYKVIYYWRVWKYPAINHSVNSQLSKRKNKKNEWFTLQVHAGSRNGIIYTKWLITLRLAELVFRTHVIWVCLSCTNTNIRDDFSLTLPCLSFIFYFFAKWPPRYISVASFDIQDNIGSLRFPDFFFRAFRMASIPSRVFMIARSDSCWRRSAFFTSLFNLNRFASSPVRYMFNTFANIGSWAGRNKESFGESWAEALKMRVCGPWIWINIRENLCC